MRQCARSMGCAEDLDAAFQGNLAARAASKRSNCKGPPGLPCAVSPQGTWPPWVPSSPSTNEWEDVRSWNTSARFRTSLEQNQVFQRRFSVVSRGKGNRDWLAEDAVPCELLSAPNSLLTGKDTGNFDGSGRAPCRKAWPDSTLAGEQCLQRRIETGNDQGRNRDVDSLIRAVFAVDSMVLKNGVALTQFLTV